MGPSYTSSSLQVDPNCDSSPTTLPYDVSLHSHRDCYFFWQSFRSTPLLLLRDVVQGSRSYWLLEVTGNLISSPPSPVYSESLNGTQPRPYVVDNTSSVFIRWEEGWEKEVEKVWYPGVSSVQLHRSPETGSLYMTGSRIHPKVGAECGGGGGGGDRSATNKGGFTFCVYFPLSSCRPTRSIRRSVFRSTVVSTPPSSTVWDK